MIRLADLALAVRDNDATVGELGGLEPWAVHQGLSVSDWLYVTEQRALRAALARDGHDPRRFKSLDVQGFDVVRLTAESRHELPLLAATWMDGFAAGLTIGRRHPNA